MNDPQYLTDRELCARWRCGGMKIWRLRKEGRLPKPFKLGGGPTGKNLTALAEVLRIEGGGDDSAPK
jgi:hypothetical protein